MLAYMEGRNRWLFEGEVCDPHQTMDYVHKLLTKLCMEDRYGASVALAARQCWTLPIDLGASASVVIRGMDGNALVAAT